MDELAGLVQSGLSAEKIRVQIKQAQENARANFEKYSEISSQVNEGLIGLLRQGAQIDLDDSIAQLLHFEVEAEQERRDAERAASKVLRQAAKKRPDLVKAFNEALSAQLEHIDRLAEMHRDARWRLMQARALYQPSKGVGPVKGTHTSLEGLLKS